MGCAATGIAADVADPEQIEAVVEATLEKHRRIDILINNAAVVWPLEEIADVDLDEWAYNIHVNLIGPFYMARTVLPVMLALAALPARAAIEIKEVVSPGGITARARDERDPMVWPGGGDQDRHRGLHLRLPTGHLRHGPQAADQRGRAGCRTCSDGADD